MDGDSAAYGMEGIGRPRPAQSINVVVQREFIEERRECIVAACRKNMLEGRRLFVVSSFVVRQLLAKSNKMGPTSITNGTNRAQGGRGTRKSANI